jgi:hypothetical protein
MGKIALSQNWQPPSLTGADRDGASGRGAPHRLPAVLGAGDRLFAETDDKLALRLVKSRPLGGGVVHMIYSPTRADG